jgi:hypothetical protein
LPFELEFALSGNVTPFELSRPRGGRYAWAR